MYPRGYTTGDEDDTANCLDTRGQPVSLPTHKGKYMGEMADFVNEQFNDLDPDWDDEPKTPHWSKTPKGYWRMKNGRFILIRSMTTDHLRNSIALCHRMGYSNFATLLECEMARREKSEEQKREQADPIYRAFKAGWNSGYKSATDTHCPDVGMSMPETLSDAWKRFNKKVNT